MAIQIVSVPVSVMVSGTMKTREQCHWCGETRMVQTCEVRWSCADDDTLPPILTSGVMCLCTGCVRDLKREVTHDQTY